MQTSTLLPNSAPRGELYGIAVALACVAIGLPSLIAFNPAPSSTFFNQAAALMGWGVFLAVLALWLPPLLPRVSSGLLGLQASLGLVLVAALASPLWTHLPWSLALSAVGMIAAAMLTAQVAATLSAMGLGATAFRAFCIGLVVAGVAGALIGIVQVHVPQWADGDWIARSGIPGRAVSNMRQPNHMSSLLLWSLIACVWLGEVGVLRRWAVAVISVLLILGVELSASRTGTLGMGMLALWGLLDRRLSRPARGLLLLAPVVYALFWFGAAAWAEHAHQVFGGQNRFSTKGDISSSRYGIWSNTLALIRMHPWAGVGYGEFNQAWTLTPFPGRPVALFDHTHNLVLQFAVELGLPLAALVLGLLGWALVVALRRAYRAGADDPAGSAPLERAAVVMVVMVCVHSLLEYPLWYAYFLLPAVFAFGLCLGAPQGAGPPVRAQRLPRGLIVGALALMLGGAGAVVDYMRVVVIFSPPTTAEPLAQRIAAGQRSWFFAHHADYAAATTAEHPVEAMAAFNRAQHYLLDARFMLAWAKALKDAGDTERASYVARRIEEFHHDQAESFFEPCATANDKPPFQCVAPHRALGYDDFR